VKVELQPITDADVPAVAAFLNGHLNARVTAVTWAAAMIPPWSAPSPNHGFLLRAGGAVVGAYLAFYSRRTIDGRTEDFCNLGAWCVQEEYRLHSLRLSRALMTQKGYTFTDLSPSGNVVDLNLRSGFQFLDTVTALVPNLPWPTRPGRVSITSDPARIAARLNAEQLQIFTDHAKALAAHHLLIRLGGRQCYLIFRRDRRKGLPVFGSLLYVDDPELLGQVVRPLTRHLLLRHGLLATLADARVLPRRPRWSRPLGAGRRKMYKSRHLPADRIDNLYSELVCVPW
jgi:hypothetical protein